MTFDCPPPPPSFRPGLHYLPIRARAFQPGQKDRKRPRLQSPPPTQHDEPTQPSSSSDDDEGGDDFMGGDDDNDGAAAGGSAAARSRRISRKEQLDDDEDEDADLPLNMRGQLSQLSQAPTQAHAAAEEPPSKD